MRIGTVTHVYGDGSAAVRWHDKPSVAPDLGHERVPRTSLSIFEISDVRAICITAIRAAALAPTIFDALDVTGTALRAIAQLSRAEVRHAD
ncbi:hypothetical protein [Robbsia andropogonis]|uniref:hypothetical protein n=1 Tax=Robbsia andropogonis TaxID=28092 RepID=UPI0020A20C4C|nr:hypothetical protein [Robbsia andropogonis]MCP1120496.1 hypothetical protein [Robbsia andropogonis]MCP1131277.1 hypothetical protein [Robbsia andropogonis]